MPLKHLTETFLILLLGLVILLTGVALDTLPLLPEGALPWAIAFAISLLYALVFYPVLKKNRAEYSFRVLHFVPAGMLVLWLVIQLIALREPRALSVHHWYTWGWSAAPVILGFFFLIVFCLQVIRRRISRVIILLLLLVPFAGFAYASERYLHWDDAVSSLVWSGSWWDVVGTGTFTDRPDEVAQGGRNLDPSENPEEEAWRRRLRALDARRQEIAERRERANSSGSSESSSVDSSSSSSKRLQSSGSSKALAQVKTPPPRLPSSGPETVAMVITMLAGYTGLIHQRAKKRIGSD